MRRALLLAALSTTASRTAAEPTTPYVETMALPIAADGSITGSFQDSSIEGGR
jgi:hypothetical protein